MSEKTCFSEDEDGSFLEGGIYNEKRRTQRTVGGLM
jgi:hypothetical protein